MLNSVFFQGSKNIKIIKRKKLKDPLTNRDYTCAWLQGMALTSEKEAMERKNRGEVDILDEVDDLEN